MDVLHSMVHKNERSAINWLQFKLSDFGKVPLTATTFNLWIDIFGSIYFKNQILWFAAIDFTKEIIKT